MACNVCAWESEQAKKMPLPDDVSQFLTVKIADFGEKKAFQLNVKKGWRWSEHMKPIVPKGPDGNAPDWCDKTHFGVCTAGQIRVTMKGGEEKVFKAGDAYYIEANHDAVCEEDAIAFEFIAPTSLPVPAAAEGDKPADK